jgi:hypothetical protein
MDYTVEIKDGFLRIKNERVNVGFALESIEAVLYSPSGVTICWDKQKFQFPGMHISTYNRINKAIKSTTPEEASV